MLGGRPLRPRRAPTDPEARPKLVVLLPARNAAADLPDWFASVERFADAVIALDDGSTDDTAALLDAHPLVKVLLTNPRRDTYEGWDDSGNRNRLLAAAHDLTPDWILSLDADERIPADDAHALRHFLDTDALPGLAYGMRCHRMIGDEGHYDRNALVVYRLFAATPGQRFPDERLHFVPVPTSIPRPLWVETTLRVQHLASVTTERRRARRDKYAEADPGNVYQGELRAPARRARDMRVFGPRARRAASPRGRTRRSRPATIEPSTDSVRIVISRDDEDRIERAWARSSGRSATSRSRSSSSPAVPTPPPPSSAACFPDVRVVELDHPALPGEARNAGLRFARGEIASFPGSHVELMPGSLAARLRAHDQGWSMVTGTTRNGTDTAAGWAAYFLDNSSVLPDRPSEPLRTAPAHCSYEMDTLLSRSAGSPTTSGPARTPG